MLKHEDIITSAWADYELLDSGDNRKLERFGKIITDRPDTQAIWSPLKPELWEKALAKFTFEVKDGRWRLSPDTPVDWKVIFKDLTFQLHFTSFKHVGLFPEHASQWDFIKEQIAKIKNGGEKPNILNLFGYTGAATLAAAKAGAKVTHVDSSKQSTESASENAKASGIEDGIRWIVDDAAAFVKREVKRGVKYEGIVLDPPAFGRGTKGQVWHIEEDLVPLLHNLKELLSEKPGSFVILSGYAAGFAPQAFSQAVESVFGSDIKGTFGSLSIQEVSSKRVLPTGIYVRFVI
jgi:23S rRNA (cytosine1962-C5)-methyltransferase